MKQLFKTRLNSGAPFRRRADACPRFTVSRNTTKIVPKRYRTPTQHAMSEKARLTRGGRLTAARRSARLWQRCSERAALPAAVSPLPPLLPQKQNARRASSRHGHGPASGAPLPHPPPLVTRKRPCGPGPGGTEPPLPPRGAGPPRAEGPATHP